MRYSEAGETHQSLHVYLSIAYNYDLYTIVGNNVVKFDSAIVDVGELGKSVSTKLRRHNISDVEAWQDLPLYVGPPRKEGS